MTFTPTDRRTILLERALVAQSLAPEGELCGTIGRAETLVVVSDEWSGARASKDTDDTIAPLASETADRSASESLVTLRGRLPTLTVGEGHDPSTDYALLNPLGEGGMGLVELAEQPVLARQVAIKRLKPGRGNTPRHVDALLSEARIMGRLEHPNIIPVHTIGLDASLGPIVVMKRIEGDVWSALLDQDASALLVGDEVTLSKHIEYLIQLCNAIQFAHSRGIIHRDIKPDNIMLGPFGELYILDWGIALDLGVSHSGEYVLAGTPGFMAPEMVLGPLTQIDEKSDVYLFGATLHLILTGRARNSGATLIQSLIKTLESGPFEFPASVPVELAAVCNKACASDPDARFESVIALQQALIDYLEHRNARQILLAAHTRFDALRCAIDDQAEDARIQRLFIEARFAFEQAMQVRPGDVFPDSNHQRLLAEMLDYELGRDNALGARAILEQIESPTPAQRAQLEAVEEKQAARAARFEYLESEVDPNTVKPYRLRFAVFVESIAIFTAAMSFAYNPRLETSLTARQIFFHITVVASIVFFAMATVWRKKLFATLYNKRFFQFVIAVFSCMGLTRLAGMLANVPVPDTLRNEMMLVGVCMILARIPGNRIVPRVGFVVMVIALVAGIWPITIRVGYYLVLMLGPLSFIIDTLLEPRVMDISPKP